MSDSYDEIVPRLKAHTNDADNWSDSYVGQTQRRDPVLSSIGDSHLHRSLGAGPLRHLVMRLTNPRPRIDKEMRSCHASRNVKPIRR